MWEIISGIGIFAILWFLEKYFKESSLGIPKSVVNYYNRVKDMLELTADKSSAEEILRNFKQGVKHLQNFEEFKENNNNYSYTECFAYGYIYYYCIKFNYTRMDRLTNLENIYLEKIVLKDNDFPIEILEYFQLNMNHLKESYEYILKQKLNKLKEKE